MANDIYSLAKIKVLILTLAVALMTEHMLVGAHYSRDLIEACLSNGQSNLTHIADPHINAWLYALLFLPPFLTKSELNIKINVIVYVAILIVVFVIVTPVWSIPVSCATILSEREDPGYTYMTANAYFVSGIALVYITVILTWTMKLILILIKFISPNN